MSPLFTRKIFSLLGVLIFSTACASIRVSIPYAHVETPETMGGEFEHGFEFSLRPSFLYEFTDAANARPPDLTHPKLDKNLSLGGKAFTSLLNNLDLGLLLSSTGTSLQIKYQFLGEPLSASAEGSHAASIFASSGIGGMSATGDQKETFGPGGYRWEASVKSSFSEIGASYGYRVRKNQMFYIGYSYADHTFNGSIVQKATDDGSSAGGTYDIGPLRGNNQTLALGLESGAKTRVRLQAGLNRERIGSFATDNGFLSFGVMSPLNDPDLKTQMIEKSLWEGSDFRALGCSYLVGFGCGQWIQDRWKTKGRYFAMADGVGLGVAATSLANNRYSLSGSAGSAIAIYFVSRIWQLVDIIIDASSSQSERPLPDPKPGAHEIPVALASWNF